MASEIRILTQDVKNPNFDRRRKYGPDARESFPAGTVFDYRAPQPDVSTLGTVFLKGGGNLSGLAEEFFKNSQPHMPATFADLMMDMGFSHADVFSVDVLEKLISTGAVSLDMVRKAAQAVLDEESKQ
jgi:hypothetical protein